MAQPEQDKIEIISGSGNVLLVAPHGCPGDDEKTAELTRALQKHLDCFAVINKKLKRTRWDQNKKRLPVRRNKAGKVIRVDLNYIPQIEDAKLEKSWLGPIDEFKKQIAANNEKCFVLLIHGADDKEIAKVDKNVAVLIGVGNARADSEKQKRTTAADNIVDQFASHLRESDIVAIEAKAAKSQSGDTANKYAGWDKNNLNQYVVRGQGGKKDTRVQSIQLEFKKTGYRDKQENIDATAEKLAKAIRKLPGFVVKPLAEEGKVIQPDIAPPAPESSAVSNLPQPAEDQLDDTLAQKAFDKLKDIFIRHYENARNKAMLDAGRYIIKTFYNDDYQLAKDKNKAVKKKSLNRLIKMLQENASDAPNKTWVYDAVALAVDDEQLKSFQTYGKISISHKLRLLPVKDIEIKKKLIDETVQEPLSVRQLAIRVKEEIGEEPGLLDLISHPGKLFSEDNAKYYSDETLAALGPDERSAIREDINKQTEKLRGYLIQFKNLLKKAWGPIEP